MIKKNYMSNKDQIERLCQRKKEKLHFVFSVQKVFFKIINFLICLIFNNLFLTLFCNAYTEEINLAEKSFITVNFESRVSRKHNKK